VVANEDKRTKRFYIDHSSENMSGHQLEADSFGMKLK